MKNFLNLLIIFLLSFLLLNIFFQKDENKLNDTIDISFTKNSYTIPASVGVKISNFKKQDFSINTCDDIFILKSGEKMDFKDFDCQDLVVKSGETKIISFVDYYSMFYKTGEYTLKANLDSREFFDSSKIENRGSISKLFLFFFYAPIYNTLMALVEFFKGSFGAAIITITILIRIILIWPQHKMLISQKKLQTLQPKIKEIQEKYKGQHHILGQKVMELYKKEKVNPFGTFGFLIIQMPILIVIYHIIIKIQDPSNLYHLYSFLPLINLSDIKFNFFGMNLLASGGTQGLILASFISLLQFLQIKLSIKQTTTSNKKSLILEKNSKDDKYKSIMPDPELMNKFMLYGLPAMVFVFTFTLSSAVGIYWGVSTIFTIAQQLIVNKK